MTLREAAAELQQKFGRSPWLSAVGIAETGEEAGTIFLYIARSNIQTRDLERSGYAGWTVRVRELGGPITN